MKQYSDVQALNAEINAYVAHFSGAPLLVGIDSCQQYTMLLEQLSVDPEKQIVRMSDSCQKEFPPSPEYMVEKISNCAQEKPVIWLGAAQAAMLYGKEAAKRFFIDFVGTSLKGPIILLCPFCCATLTTINSIYRNEKIDRSIICMPCGTLKIPSICVHSDASLCTSMKYANGIKALLRILEDGKTAETIHVVTSCDKKYLADAVYPCIESISAYQTLCKREPTLSVTTTETNGTGNQWENMLKGVEEAGSLMALCQKSLCDVQQLPNTFLDYLKGTEEERFLCFVALKSFHSANHDYLGACLCKCASADDLIRCFYETILDSQPDDAQFSTFWKQRCRVLKQCNINHALMKDYCAHATIHGRDVLRYLSDQSEEEKAAIIHALCTYPYSYEEMVMLLKEAAPELALYLRKFVFDAYNTKLLESDALFREKLTDYFQRYKLQKLTNHHDDDFVTIVEEEAQQRSFTKLPARSAIVKRLEKQEAQAYFIDALGVEFLAYVEAKAEQYGMLCSCQIGHCNLPSITSKNTEFYDLFPPNTILKEERIDNLKHHGKKYDFRVTTEPIHVFDELEVLNQDLKKMADMLAEEKVKKIIILSDHGASRLAVTYQSENEKLALEEAGQHSGRCCPAAEDPHIAFASYEDGFAVLANYERFKGSRKAEVETHGGASLEEVLVPVITLTAKPRTQEVRFQEDTVLCSMKMGASILMYANPPLHEPRMVVLENDYAGVFEGDKHNVRFTMPELRRKGKFQAEIYDGKMKIATLPFETTRATKNNDF